MLHQTTGLVFKTIKYGETSLIVELYTQSHGLLRGVIRGARTPKARVKAIHFQVMSWVEIVAYLRPGRELHHIQEARAALVYQAIPFQVVRSAVGQFMAEVARKAIREEEPNPPLFDLLYKAFTQLDQASTPFYNLHLAFMAHLAGHLGFLPAGDWDPTTPIFDLREGNFTVPAGGSVWQIDPELSRLFYQLLLLPLEESHQVALTRSQRHLLLEHLLDYFRLHLEGFPEIKAHQILREVLE